MSSRSRHIGDLVRVRAARDPFNTKLAVIVRVYPDGGLLLRFNGEERAWPYSPRHVVTAYSVVRNCCTSGNCVVCNGKTPVGTPLRIVQQTGLTKPRARDVKHNWLLYAAEIVAATVGADEV